MVGSYLYSKLRLGEPVLTVIRSNTATLHCFCSFSRLALT